MFWQGRDRVHQTMRRVAQRLERAGIPYAILGGMAVFAHKHRRATNDVDVLLTPEGLAEFKERIAPKNYRRVAGRPRRFLDRQSSVTIDFLVSGRFPGSGRPGPIAFPSPVGSTVKRAKVKVVNLPTLIELKLAARRWQDFADVVNLIRVNRLDESFGEQLHPSVRRDYVECLEEKRREDEYEAREDRAIAALEKQQDDSRREEE